MPISTSSWDSSINGTYPQEFQDRYRSLGDAIYDEYSTVDTSLLKPVFNNAQRFAGYWVMGEAFVAWFYHNLSGGASSWSRGGNSWNNPYQFQYSAPDKSNALRALGCRSDDEDMCDTFNRRKNSGGRNGQGTTVGNTIYTISQCDPTLKQEQSPFVWGSDGSLCIYDRYNFDSEEDFSSSQAGPFGVLAMFASVPGIGAALINSSPIGEWRDSFFNYIGLSPKTDKEPYLTWDNPNNPIKKSQSGKSRYMYTRACFSAEEVEENNSELYYDRLRRGLISYNSVPGAIPVGDKQPNPFLGLPFQPPVSVDIEPGPNYFGFNYGDYPAPFNSYSQGITNATYDLGPYAKINKFGMLADPSTNDVEESTCDSGNDALGKINDEYGLYGRIIIITSGSNAGDLGFVLQDWYHFNDEPYNTVDGTATGQRYQSKAQWWENSTKISMPARFIHVSGQPIVTVRVAASGPIYGASNYYPGPNLSSVNDLSYTALQLMISSAALVRWL